MTMRYLLLDEHRSQAAYALWAQMQTSDPWVLQLEQIVSQAMPDIPSTTSLAEQLHMSTRTLHRKMRAATGLSTEAFIRRQRAHQAQYLLQSSTLTLAAVAHAVGYESSAALRKLLADVLDATPAQIRIKPMKR